MKVDIRFGAARAAAACALLLVFPAVSCASAASTASPVALESLLRRPQYDSLSISPGGDYLAATVMLDDRSVLTIVRRDTMQISGTIDPGKEGYVEGFYWVSPDRVFASTSRRFGLDAGASMLPVLYAVDADGRNGKQFPASIVDTLVGDDEHVLVSVCEPAAGRVKGCWNEVKRVRVDLKGRIEDVVKAPALNASFGVDNAGHVRFATCYDTEDNQQVYVRGVEGDAPWQLIHDESTQGREIHPLGTSADDRVAYLRVQMPAGPDAIVEYDFATGKRRELLRDPVADPVGLIISADGRQPIGALYRVGLPRLKFWQPTHPDAVLQAEVTAAFPGEFALITSQTADRAQAVVTVSSDREPGRYYLMDQASGELKLLNRSRPWLSADALVPMKPIALAARDGLPLHGFLTTLQRPGSPPGPLVVVPHGGPYWIRDDWRFDTDVQALATRGYTVLQVNFRGSAGFGRAFADAGLLEWGGRMQDDLADATRWAIAQGHGVAGRVCILGASYGGYAALMGAVKDPDLYRCAIGVAGVYDLGLMKRWGDIQRTRFGESYLDRALGTDPAVLAQRSPARRAGEIKAAVMLVHGGRDFRVSPEHAKAMREALEDAGIAYEGYFPSYEAHGIADPDNQREYYTRVLAFLDRHIGAGAAVGTAGAGTPGTGSAPGRALAGARPGR